MPAEAEELDLLGQAGLEDLQLGPVKVQVEQGRARAERFQRCRSRGACFVPERKERGKGLAGQEPVTVAGRIRSAVAVNIGRPSFFAANRFAVRLSSLRCAAASSAAPLHSLYS